MSVKELDSLDKIVSLAKARGFIFQSSDIYGGLGAVYDYGPLGVELKRNISNHWWKAMTQKHENIVGVDAAIFMHPKVWKASGHVEGFNDPMIDDKQSKKRYRADMLIENYIEKRKDDLRKEYLNLDQEKINLDIEMFLRVVDKIIKDQIASNKEGLDKYEQVLNLLNNLSFHDDLDYNFMNHFADLIDSNSEHQLFSDLLNKYLNDNELKKELLEIYRLTYKLETAGSRKSLNEDLHEIIMEEEIRAPESGAFDWTEVRQFNLMFKTQFGATSSSDDDDAVYLRPETAQGIFVNFKNVMDTSRQQIPFGIAQIGKAFRNEVVARQFVFRMREFEQMEMQYFVEPGTDAEQYERWLEERMNWHKALGIRPEKLRSHPHPEDKLAHYAEAAADIQYEYPIGWQEVEGIHNRTDFDLSQHSEYSGKKLEYYDQQQQKRYTPYVIETSVGLDRTVLMALCDAYREEEVDGDTRTVLKLNPKIAPTKVGIFPLIKKDKLQDLAHKITEDLRKDYKVLYDESGSIGKRYRRQDEAGTPFCITVDFDGVESEGEDTVTIRYRDDMTQDRVAVSRIKEVITKKMSSWKSE